MAVHALLNNKINIEILGQDIGTIRERELKTLHKVVLRLSKISIIDIFLYFSLTLLLFTPTIFEHLDFKNAYRLPNYKVTILNSYTEEAIDVCAANCYEVEAIGSNLEFKFVYDKINL